MYPNHGPPNTYGGQYPSAPFGSGYPQMPQPGFPPQQQGFGAPQQGGFMPAMPQPGMPQPGMPQPGSYQSPPMNQPFGAGYPSQQPAYPTMGQQPGFPPQQQGFGAAQPAYPSMGQQPGFPPQQQGFGAPQQAYQPQQAFGAPPQQPIQQQYQTPAYAAPPTQQQGAQYGAPPMQQPGAQYGAYGQPQQAAVPIQRGRPTVVPAANFNASNDAAALRKAMKGFGTDEDAIIEVLCRRTNAQRIQIAMTFKTAYGKDLISDIKSEVSGNFEILLVALLTETNEYYARELHEAMSGGGTDEDVLIEVMCTMSNHEIRSISHMYQRIFGKNLEQELRSDTSGSFKRLMTSLSCATRDESMVTDVNSAQNDAQELKRAGIDKWGTDESAFNRIFCLRNYEQLKLVAQEYQKLTGHSLEQDIKKEFSGDIEDGLLSILRVAHNRPEFFARRLHKSMAGIGTNDRSLIRLVASRCEIDMMDVKEEFQRYYGKTLKSFIKGDTSGHYKHAIYALIGENKS